MCVERWQCYTAAYFPGSTETASVSRVRKTTKDEPCAATKQTGGRTGSYRQKHKNRKRVAPAPFQNTLWDLLESLDDARQTGETGPLLVVLTNFIGAASGHRQEPLLSLTKIIPGPYVSHVGSKN